MIASWNCEIYRKRALSAKLVFMANYPLQRSEDLYLFMHMAA
jgi:hypothetical protein